MDVAGSDEMPIPRHFVPGCTEWDEQRGWQATRPGYDQLS